MFHNRELRGCTPFGMLEYGNDGTVGSVKMESCLLGGIFFESKKK
jgi:hypothetical protein